MRKRDRVQNRVRALFTTDSGRAGSLPEPLAQQISVPSTPVRPSSPCLTAPSGGTPASKTSHNPLILKALSETIEKLPQSERAAFVQASKTIEEHTILSNVRAYDAAHKENSPFRPHADRLTKFLDLLNRFMGGVAIGIQANPEVSALVVGAVRVVIDLALNFTTFFSRLMNMVCTFEDYLGPLAEYAHAADIELVEKTVVNAYANLLEFGWKARRVFVDTNGDQRKWTSLRAFMRQHWETFESEYVSIREDLQHHLDTLLHSVQALHFDAFRKAEETRRREEERKSVSFDIMCVNTWLTFGRERKVSLPLLGLKHRFRKDPPGYFCKKASRHVRLAVEGTEVPELVQQTCILPLVVPWKTYARNTILL